MKSLLPFCCLSLVLLWFISGCAPPPTYQYNENPVSIKQLAVHETSKSRVSASIESWRNTGIELTRGSVYHISAQGKWRTYPTCNFTGPDGIGLYKAWCVKSPLFPELLPGYSHSMLVARIGEQGKIFAVGAGYEFTAQHTGTLFFRINDKLAQDNEGFVDVEIKALGTSPVNSGASMAAQLSAQPSGAAQKPASLAEVPGKPRTALVIGNSDYLFSPLKNPLNDAQAMASALKLLGFQVTLRLNADLQQMESAIDDFSRRLASGNQVALFYYAGHGVQVDGENYLIPTDAKIARQSDVRYKAVNIGQVLGAMGEVTDNLNIVILDACRDNPLPRSFRTAGRGLARVEGPKGTIIGFATSPGSVAADGEGDNGVYTKHLLENMNKPGIPIEQVFKKVLQGVDQETSGQQIPWTESSFTGDFTFLPAAAR